MKKLLRLFSIFHSTFSFSQQTPEIEWQNTIGAHQSDGLNSIQQTQDGGYILGGYSTSGSSGDKTEESEGFYDYWIVKTDASGNIQWQNTIGGSDNEFLQSIQQTADGGYILGGYSSSDISGDKTENTFGGTDYWIVKTDATGNIQWQNTINANESDVLYSVQQTTDGGYILGGYSSSNNLVDKTEDSNGAFDYWIVKTDVSGNILWQNTIGGSGWDILRSVQQTSDGGYILGGYSSSNISGDKTENNIGNDDYWIVKTDESGNIQWQNTIGGNYEDYLYFIRQTADGGYILGGYSYSNISGDKTENNIGPFELSDYWIVKTNDSGVIQWENTIGGNSPDFLFSIQQTLDGGYIFGGNSGSNISGDKTENSIADSRDYWIVKTDTIGAIQWQNTIGGEGYDGLNSISLTADGGYVLGGTSTSNISGDKTEDCVGSEDYWIVKLQGCDPCPVPTNLNTTNINQTFAKLSWQTNWCPTGTVGYKVKYRPVGTSAWTLKNVNGNTGFKNINNLTPNTQYQWRVGTKCSSIPNVFSAWSGNSFFTTPLRLGDFEEEFTINIHPNPATDQLILETNQEIEKIIIQNTLGQTVLAQELETHYSLPTTQIDISSLPAGVYLLTAFINQQQVTEMFVKQ